MNSVSIKVVGRVSKRILSKYKKVFGIDKLNSNEVVLFCCFSEFDIPIGKVFNEIEDMVNREKINGGIVLKNVTQQFWKPFDAIPAGWKTICHFEFPLGDVPLIVKNLPEVGDWYDSNTSITFIQKLGDGI